MAQTANIEVYKGNTINVNVTVSGLSSLAGFTAKMIVKKNKTDADADKSFEVAGTINALVLSFVITAANNDLDAGGYYYEVYLSDATQFFTVASGSYRVIQSVKN